MAASSKAKELGLEVSGKGPVKLRVTPVDQATATLEIGVDYGQAPLPNVQYDADYCDVLQGRTGVTLVFAKIHNYANRERMRLRTKIEITFPEQMFVRQLWGSTRDFYPTVKGLVGDDRLQAVSLDQDTDRVQCFHANNVFMAVMGREAVLDFYYISPGDVHLVRSRQKSEVLLDPVVRVVVSAPLLLEFLDKCSSIAATLGPKFAHEEA